jgi:hypothetical protein
LGFKLRKIYAKKLSPFLILFFIRKEKMEEATFYTTVDLVTCMEFFILHFHGLLLIDLVTVHFYVRWGCRFFQPVHEQRNLILDFFHFYVLLQF